VDLLKVSRLLGLRRGPRAFEAAALAWVSLAACVPDLDTDESTVSEPRVLAVVAEPAEPSAEQSVTYRALVADADGALEEPDLTWFQCLASRPLAELGPISRECLRVNSGKLNRLGSGATASAPLPFEACSLFGPNPPPAAADEPPGRPADPDETGGYKLPVLLSHGDDITLYEQRIYCGLSGVTTAISAEFTRRYRRNQNPSVEQVHVERANGAIDTLDADAVLVVKPGERVELEVVWPSCPRQDACGDGVCGIDESTLDCAEDCAAPAVCGGQERYLWFDPVARGLTAKRESIRVAWYATGGTYEE
jgi:hypothetical protein